MEDFDVLIVRLVTGGLMAGHGAQKLFGWFGGYGLKGTAGFMEMLGLKPGTQWAATAAASEFGGGALTALGFLNPLGPIGIISSMAMATAKAHWGKPIWAGEGGAELPVTNMAAALAVAIAGPGRYSLDRAFGIKLPRFLVALTILAAAGSLAVGINSRPAPPPATQESGAVGAETAGASPQGAGDTAGAGQSVGNA